MQELINDVINDLVDGHITKAEAKERVARIVSVCEKAEHWNWVPYPNDRYWVPRPAEPLSPIKIMWDATGTMPLTRP